MDSKELLLPSSAALWALCTIVFNGTKELNAIRDRIMFADAEGHRTNAAASKASRSQRLAFLSRSS
jgi:hypothetical protein